MIVSLYIVVIATQNQYKQRKIGKNIIFFKSDKPIAIYWHNSMAKRLPFDFLKICTKWESICGSKGWSSPQLLIKIWKFKIGFKKIMSDQKFMFLVKKFLDFVSTNISWFYFKLVRSLKIEIISSNWIAF